MNYSLAKTLIYLLMSPFCIASSDRVIFVSNHLMTIRFSSLQNYSESANHCKIKGCNIPFFSFYNMMVCCEKAAIEMSISQFRGLKYYYIHAYKLSSLFDFIFRFINST